MTAKQKELILSLDEEADRLGASADSEDILGYGWAKRWESVPGYAASVCIDELREEIRYAKSRN